jgi:hypothetical protein
MTAPERFADSQIPLAPRAPSIHGPLHATETWVNAQEILVESGKERGRKLDVHK